MVVILDERRTENNRKQNKITKEAEGKARKRTDKNTGD